MATDALPRDQVEQALIQTQRFLDEHLVPELAESQLRSEHKETQLLRYSKLLDHIKLHDADSLSAGAPSEVKTAATRQALVSFSNGLQVQAEIEQEEPYLVCLPVGEELGERPSLFLEMTPQEASAFTSQLVPILERSMMSSRAKMLQLSHKHQKMLVLLSQLRSTLE